MPYSTGSRHKTGILFAYQMVRVRYTHRCITKMAMSIHAYLLRLCPSRMVNRRVGISILEFCVPVMPYMVPPTVGPAGPSTAPYMVRGTIHGALHGPVGPSTAPYLLRPDQPRRHGWSPLSCNVLLDYLRRRKFIPR